VGTLEATGEAKLLLKPAPLRTTQGQRTSTLAAESWDSPSSEEEKTKIK